MGTIDHIQLAQYCKDEFMKVLENNPDDKYIDTTYFAIDEDNNVLSSKTPHILANASRCILIHTHCSLAITNWYDWYKVQYIDENGCVTDGDLGGGYEIKISSWGSYANQVLAFSNSKTHLFFSNKRNEWPEEIKLIWKLYLKCLECENEKEVELLCELARKDREITELERENDSMKYINIKLEKEKEMFQGLLNEIKDLIQNESRSGS